MDVPATGAPLLPMPPLLKWPGGKSAELPALVRSLVAPPARIIEPFAGGAALSWHLAACEAALNDTCSELIAFYRAVATGDPQMLGPLQALGGLWTALGDTAGLQDLAAAFASAAHLDSAIAACRVDPVLCHGIAIDPSGLQTAIHDALRAKIQRMRRLQATRGDLSVADIAANLEGAIKAGLYLAVRDRFNATRDQPAEPSRAALFYFLRETCYAAMFRHSRDGRFNVPFGGLTYRGKDLAGKTDHLQDSAVVARLQRTALRCGDFEDFLDSVRPTAADLVFADPPYDSAFSTYARNAFGPADHRRLAACLQRMQRHCAVRLVVNDTPLMRALYPASRWRVTAYPKTYRWTIKDRNERATVHLLIASDPEPQPTIDAPAAQW